MAILSKRIVGVQLFPSYYLRYLLVFCIHSWPSPVNIVVFDLLAVCQCSMVQLFGLFELALIRVEIAKVIHNINSRRMIWTKGLLIACLSCPSVLSNTDEIGLFLFGPPFICLCNGLLSYLTVLFSLDGGALSSVGRRSAKVP